MGDGLEPCFGFMRGGKSENRHPKILVLSTTQLSHRFLDNKFIKYDASPSKIDIEQGAIRRMIGMNVQSSTRVPN